MITYNVTDYEIREGGAKVQEISGFCLSSDTKPTAGIANGSILTEMNTGKVFLFNEAGKLSDTWIDKKKYIWRRKYLEKQKSRGTDRFRQYQMEFRKGLAYWSITQELAGYILSRKKLIRKMFRFSLCGDEVFMQILAYNSPFRDRIYTSPGVEGQCLRCSTWPLEDRGVRRTGHNFYVQDLNWLLESEDLFALKFEGEAGTWLMGHIRSRYEDE